MKALAVALLAVALGITLWQSGTFKKTPPPAPPAPPPAILSEPAPVIDEAQLQKVLKSAADMDPNVRWEAVVFLDKIKSPRAMPLIQQMLQTDMDAGLRTKLIGLLAQRRGDDVSQALVGALRDQEPDVRLASLRALETLGDLSVAAAIADGPIRDEDERVRLEAMHALNVLQDLKQKQIDDARQRYEADRAAAAAAAQKK